MPGKSHPALLREGSRLQYMEEGKDTRIFPILLHGHSELIKHCRKQVCSQVYNLAACVSMAYSYVTQCSNSSCI